MTLQRIRIGRTLLVFVAIAVVTAGAMDLIWAPSQSSTPMSQIQVPNPRPVSECLGGKPSGYRLIIANDHGFNNSVSYLRNSNGSKLPNYPVIEVAQGSVANILFCNLSQHETFGIVIERYLPAGVVLPPNKATLITFKADQSGEFRFYNNIFNSIDLYLRNGLLVVRES